MRLPANAHHEQHKRDFLPAEPQNHVNRTVHRTRPPPASLERAADVPVSVYPSLMSKGGFHCLIGSDSIRTAEGIDMTRGDEEDGRFTGTMSPGN